MITSVAVLFLTIFNGSTETEIATFEFYSYESCEAAAQELKQSYEDSGELIDVVTKCVLK